MKILTTLLLIFVTLKLVEVITWSWWWVLSPVGIPLTIFTILVGISFWASRKG